jgi:hypothetical protein
MEEAAASEGAFDLLTGPYVARRGHLIEISTQNEFRATQRTDGEVIPDTGADQGYLVDVQPTLRKSPMQDVPV